MLGVLLVALILAFGWVLIAGCGRNRPDPDELGPLTRPSYFDQPKPSNRAERRGHAPVR